MQILCNLFLKHESYVVKIKELFFLKFQFHH